jgi:NTP pyrophosphatase (non-canonical NTP hydrolase)
VTRTEHLLFILAEECAEVAQRASKAARFGLDEIQPDQAETNRQRIGNELDDLWAVVGMLREQRVLPLPSITQQMHKHAKVEKYLSYSATCGTLTEES